MTTFSLVLTTGREPARPQPGKLYIALRRNLAFRDGATVNLTRTQRIALAVLAARAGGLTPNAYLIEALYCDREDGGASWPAQILNTLAGDLSTICPALGLRLERTYQGWTLTASETFREAAE